MLLDAGGTLLHPVDAVASTYARVAREHGHELDPASVHEGFRRAFSEPWPGPRYVGDGSPFWRHVVFTALGVQDEALFQALYALYRRPDAWTVAPGARELLARCRSAGVRTAVVSNWDTRLRPLLDALELTPCFDFLAISAEVGAEKPDPELVHAALRALHVAPHQAVLIGDSPEDAAAAHQAGCVHWGMPDEVADFATVEARIFGDATASELD